MKISDLPYLDTTSIYYGGSFGLNLVGNGDDSGDYVTGQVSVSDLADSYIRDKVARDPSAYLSEGGFLLFKTGESSDEIDGIMYDSFISSMFETAAFENGLSDYLSEYLPDYLSNNISSYIDDYMSTYIYDIQSISYTSEITGVVVNTSNTFRYIPSSSFQDLVLTCIYYNGTYPGGLTDSTEIAGLMDAGSGYSNQIAPILLGDIVDYIRNRI